MLESWIITIRVIRNPLNGFKRIKLVALACGSDLRVAGMNLGKLIWRRLQRSGKRQMAAWTLDSKWCWRCRQEGLWNKHGGKIIQFQVICNNTPTPKFLLHQPNGTLLNVITTYCFHVYRFRKEMPKSLALSGTLLAGSVPALAPVCSGRETWHTISSASCLHVCICLHISMSSFIYHPFI